jgi:hypothetical protein
MGVDVLSDELPHLWAPVRLSLEFGLIFELHDGATTLLLRFSLDLHIFQYMRIYRIMQKLSEELVNSLQPIAGTCKDISGKKHTFCISYGRSLPRSQPTVCLCRHLTVLEGRRNWRSRSLDCPHKTLRHTLFLGSELTQGSLIYIWSAVSTRMACCTTSEAVTCRKAKHPEPLPRGLLVQTVDEDLRYPAPLAAAIALNPSLRFLCLRILV